MLNYPVGERGDPVGWEVAYVGKCGSSPLSLHTQFSHPSTRDLFCVFGDSNIPHPFIYFIGQTYLTFSHACWGREYVVEL